MQYSHDIFGDLTKEKSAKTIQDVEDTLIHCWFRLVVSLSLQAGGSERSSHPRRMNNNAVEIKTVRKVTTEEEDKAHILENHATVENKIKEVTEKEAYIEAIRILSSDEQEEQVINQVEYKELSSNDQLENHVLFTEEGADVEAIGILSSDEQEKQVINQVEYKKVSSNDQLENYILFTEKEACIEAIGILSSDEQEDESSSERIDNDADYKNFSSCSPL